MGAYSSNWEEWNTLLLFIGLPHTVNIDFNWATGPRVLSSEFVHFEEQFEEAEQ